MSDAFINALGDEWRAKESIVPLFSAAFSHSIDQFGFSVPNPYPDVVEQVLDTLRRTGAVQTDGDDYTGIFLKSSPNFQRAVKNYISNTDAGKRIANIGFPAFDRAVRTIANEEGWQASDGYIQTLSEAIESAPPSDGAKIAPASDRLVTFNHNEIGQFEADVSEIVEVLEDDNGEPEHLGLRERLLGQLKAGRELIRAGEFRAYLLYEVLVRALNELIEKYGNPTIKNLANALLGALVSKLFEGQ